MEATLVAWYLVYVSNAYQYLVHQSTAVPGIHTIPASTSTSRRLSVPDAVNRKSSQEETTPPHRLSVNRKSVLVMSTLVTQHTKSLSTFSLVRTW